MIRYVEPVELDGEHPVPTQQIVLERITEGPYRGRWAAHLYRDERRIAGTRRRPYYGHVWRLGRRWMAAGAGGYRPQGFATRHEARAWIAKLGRAS